MTSLLKCFAVSWRIITGSENAVANYQEYSGNCCCGCDPLAVWDCIRTRHFLLTRGSGLLAGRGALARRDPPPI
eukprot:scaffold73726_cov33-Prasinocladus_malaysianus.AAC.1